jgi:hypothetical protein
MVLPWQVGCEFIAVTLQQAEPVNHGCVVATNPLSVGGWERFLPGEMKVLHQGNIVFTGRMALHEPASDGKPAKDGVLLAPKATEGQAILAAEKAGT